jgi:hypothetical protein
MLITTVFQDLGHHHQYSDWMIQGDLWQKHAIFWSLSVQANSRAHPTGTRDNLSSTDINNEWSNTSIPATHLHGIQGGNCTSYSPLYSISMNNVRTFQCNS